MRILLVGAGGTLGGAVRAALTARGHTVVDPGGDVTADVADPVVVARAYEGAGPLDAVVVTPDDTVFGPLTSLTAEETLSTLRGRALSHGELVRQGTRHTAPTGSFTVVTGVLTEEPTRAAAAAEAADGLVEAFVRTAAADLRRRRINAVSPGIAVRSPSAGGTSFPRVEAALADRVAAACVHSVEGTGTGQVHRVR